MASYQYTALNASGGRVEGVLAGQSEQAVLIELESRRLTPVAIEARREVSRRAGRVSGRRLGESYVQVSDLLHAGVPLLRSLKLLAGRKSRPKLAAIYRTLADDVEKGADLGAAMGGLPEYFPPVHVAMVRAGEKGGFLEGVLGKLGELVLRQADLRAKVIGNLIYPGVLLTMGLAVGGVIFGFFVPMFRPIFEKAKGGVPALTRVVFAVSDALGKYGLVTAVILGAIAFTLWRLSKSPAVNQRMAVIVTRLPIIGPLVRGFATARLCSLLGTMLSNGVPMLSALQIARDGTGNRLMEQAVDQAADAVRAGQPLAPQLAASGLIDDDVVEMIAVGEAANNLDEVLVKVAATIELRLDGLLGVAVRLIEPLLLVFLAGVVGVVAAALLLPMTNLSGSL